MTAKFTRKIGLIVAAALALPGCGTFKSTKSREKGEDAMAAVGFTPFQGSEVQGPPTGYALSQGLNTSIDGADIDTLAALSDCNCADHFAGAMFKKLSQIHGVLPQILVPSIRDNVRNDSKLQLLLRLPPGIGSLFKGLFATDEKVATSIREGLIERLKRALPSPMTMTATDPFRFDAFSQIQGGAARSDGGSSTSFDIASQTVKWNFIFGIGALWDGKQAVGNQDIHLQLLETAKVMTEWKYLYGIDRNPLTGQNYGGMTVSLDQSMSPIGPFDPKVDPNGRRFLTGTYQVNFPANSSLVDLATNINETWTRNSGDVSLSEQAQSWLAAARAFHRMRPSNRGAISSAFGAQSLFPDDAHRLPLIFLKGLNGLLKPKFIDTDTHEIFSVVNPSGSSGAHASLSDLTSLGAALAAWIQELNSLSDAQLDAATLAQLQAAPQDMTKGLQLIVQTIMNDHTSIVHDDERQLLGMTTAQSANAAPSLFQVTATLAFLVNADRQVLHSEFIKDKNLKLLDWFAYNYLARIWDGSITGLKSAEVIGMYQMLSLYGGYQEIAATVWYKNVMNVLQQTIAHWDSSFP